MTIKSQVISALRWTAAGRLAGQAATWAITIYVISVLKPADYGLMGMATVVIAFSELVNEVGVIPALVQAKDVTERIVRQLFGFVLLSNFVTFAALFLSAPLVADFFNEPRLILIVRVLSFNTLIGALSSVPMALLRRELDFKGISMVDFSAMVLSSSMTLVLALQGMGVWALVAATVVNTAVRSIGILVISEFRMAPIFKFDGLRRFFIFGANSTVEKILWSLNSQIDVILIGKLLGKQVLGVYEVAFQIATLPVSKVMSILIQVAFPAFARIHEDRELSADYFLKTVRLACLVFFPVLWGLSSVASEFVDLFMGNEWDNGVAVLTLIPLIMPFRALSLLTGPLVDGHGRPDIGVRNLVTFTFLIPGAVFLGTHWGIVAVCLLMVVATLIGLVINFWMTLPLVNIRFGRMIEALTPALFCACVMYAAVWAVKSFVFVDVAPLVRLIGAVATGGVVYCGMTLLINRDSVMMVWRLARH